MEKLRKVIRSKLLSGVDSRIKKLDMQLVSLACKNDALTSKNDALTSKSDALETQIKSIVPRVDKLTKAVDAEKKLRIESNRSLISKSIPNSIFVCTIPKSGTTYTINFLANYIVNLNTELTEKVRFDELVQNGVFHTVDTPLLMKNIDDISQYSKSISSISSSNNAISRNCSFDHIIGTHKYHESYNFNKAIFLYRNPLDFLVSIYNFEYVKKGIDKPFSECVKEKLAGSEYSFVERYMRQSELCSKYGALHVSYESIMKDPKSAFTSILDYLAIPVVNETLELALEYSSIDSVKEQEKSSGKILLGSERGLKGSFITSGKIGQWKDYYDDALLDYVRSTLASYGLDLDDFIYE